MKKKIVCVFALLGVSALFASAQDAVASLGRVVPGERVSSLAASSPSGSQAVVEKLNVSKGSSVKKGDVVAQIYGASRAKAALERAKTSLEVVKTARDLKILQQKNMVSDLEGSFEQNQKILAEKSPPRREREQLEYEQEALSRKIAQARAMLPFVQASENALVADMEAAYAEVNALYSEYFVKSPIDGEVIDMHVEEGESVGPDGICEIADTSFMYVEAEVYVSDISKVKIGSLAEISSEALGDGKVGGKVVEISSFVRTNKTFSSDPSDYANLKVVVVKIKLDSPEKFKNLIGTQVNVRISSAS